MLRNDPLLVWSYSKARPHFSCNSWNQRAAVIFSWNLVPKCRYETSLTLLLSQITTKKIVVKHSANVILVLALFSIRLEKAHCPLPKQNKFLQSNKNSDLLTEYFLPGHIFAYCACFKCLLNKEPDQRWNWTRQRVTLLIKISRIT